MNIKFIAIMGKEKTTYKRIGPMAIDIGGEEYDFSRMKEGERLNTFLAIKSPWFFPYAMVQGGRLHLCLFHCVESHGDLLATPDEVVKVDTNGFIEPPVAERPDPSEIRPTIHVEATEKENGEH